MFQNVTSSSSKEAKVKPQHSTSQQKRKLATEVVYSTDRQKRVQKSSTQHYITYIKRNKSKLPTRVLQDPLSRSKGQDPRRAPLCKDLVANQGVSVTFQIFNNKEKC